jgi:replication factor A1
MGEMKLIGDHGGSEMKVKNLKEYSRDVDLVVKVVSKSDPKEVYLEEDQEYHRISHALVADETGAIIFNLWDNNIGKVEEGDYIRLENGYVTSYEGSLYLSVGLYGDFLVLDSGPFMEVNLENNLSEKMRGNERLDHHLS